MVTCGNFYLNLYKHHACFRYQKELLYRVINDWDELPLQAKTAQDSTTSEIYYDKYFQDVNKVTLVNEQKLVYPKGTQGSSKEVIEEIKKK